MGVFDNLTATREPTPLRTRPCMNCFDGDRSIGCRRCKESGVIAIRGLAIIVSMHGTAFALAWQGDDAIEEFVSDAGGVVGEGFPLKHIDHAKLDDGVWIAELYWVNDGPSDWPGGGNEYTLGLREVRAATAEEWQHHCEGEWPWEPLR